MYTILHWYLIVAISLHRLWLMSNTTKRPTTSEFLQLLRTSAKFFQSACSAILYQAFRDALRSLCLAAACRIALRLTIRMPDLRITRSLSIARGRLSSGKRPRMGLHLHPSRCSRGKLSPAAFGPSAYFLFDYHT